VQTLASADLMIRPGRLPKGDQPLVGIAAAQHPERERDAARLYLALDSRGLARDVDRAFDGPGVSVQ